MVQARLSMLIVLFFCLRPTMALAQENLGWHGGANEDGAYLYYGIPQSDHAPISFTCERGRPGMDFALVFEPVNVSQGDVVEVVLQAGDLAVPITTTMAWMEMDDSFVLEGRTMLDAPLMEILSASGTLLVYAEDSDTEFPLDGARQAAAEILETCARQDAHARPDRVVSCAVSAWSTDPDPAGLNVRAAPGSDAQIVGNLPAAREMNDYRFATEVSITGSQAGWLRISEGWLLDYIFDEPVETVFAGKGWVSGRYLGLRLNYRHLHKGPSFDRPVVATLTGSRDGYSYGPDSFAVTRVYACRGSWVDVEGAITVDGNAEGPTLRGWTVMTCSNQVTTCP